MPVVFPMYIGCISYVIQGIRTRHRVRVILTLTFTLTPAMPMNKEMQKRVRV